MNVAKASDFEVFTSTYEDDAGCVILVADGWNRLAIATRESCHCGAIAGFCPASNSGFHSMTTTTDSRQDMSFKVSPEFHRAFKLAAAMSDLSMKELLDGCFRAWIDKNCTDTKLIRILLKMLLPKA